MSLWPLLYLPVTEVEAEVMDKLKYIEETKETMDKNTKKLAEIVDNISGIHTGTFLEVTVKFQIFVSGTREVSRVFSLA